MTPAPDYTAWYALLNSDYESNAKAGVTLLNAGNLPGAYLAWDQSNRDQVLGGESPIDFSTYYPFPPTFAGTPPLQVPYNIAVPPLSPSQLALISIQAAPAPVPAPAPTPSPAPSGTGSGTPSASSSSGSGSGSTPDAKSGGSTPLELVGDPGSYCDEFPDDPICQLFNDPGGIITGGGGGGGGGINETVNISTGLNTVDVDQIVEGSLDGLWAAAVEDVDQVVAGVVADVQSALTGIGNALTVAWSVLARLGGFILSFLSNLWDDVIKGLLAALHAVEEALSYLYNNVLVPLVQAMQQLRNWLLQLYQNWIRPLLIVLQYFRQALSILNLFGVKFGTKLDTAIADLQARIMTPLYYLLSYTNAIANWVNLIVTANYLIQQPLWLASFQAYLGQTFNMQVNAMNPPIDPATLATIQATSSFPSVPQTVSDLEQWTSAQTGGLADDIATYSALLDEHLNPTVSA